MEARVGTLAVGTVFESLLTGRRGTVRALALDRDVGVLVSLTSPPQLKSLHPDVRVRVMQSRVVEATH